MAKRKLLALFHEADQARVSTILDALRAKGCSFLVSGAEPGKKDAVLFFLSSHVTAESEQVERFIQLDAAGRDIIPVNLDGSTPPTLVESALYARNTVFAENRSPEELAERISSALRPTGPSPLPKILAAAAALLIVAAGIWFWRSRAAGTDAVPAMAEDIRIP